MRVKDECRIKGHARILLYRPDGQIKRWLEIDNLTVTAGRNWIAGRMDDVPPAAMSHIAVGTGATAPAAGDTALVAESARVVLDSTVNSGNTVTYTATFGPGVGTAALQEAGIFNAGAGGTMLARITFPVINKGALDTLTVAWDQNVN